MPSERRARFATLFKLACLLLIAFRKEDRWALDTLLFRRRPAA